MKIKCLACLKEITINNWNKSKLYCSSKCKREYNNYIKGKKKKEEMFIDLRGKRWGTINKQKKISAT